MTEWIQIGFGVGIGMALGATAVVLPVMFLLRQLRWA